MTKISRIKENAEKLGQQNVVEACDLWEYVNNTSKPLIEKMHLEQYQARIEQNRLRDYGSVSTDFEPLVD